MSENNEEIMKPLGILSVMLIMPVSYVISLGFERFFQNGHGNIFAVSVALVMAATFQTGRLIYKRNVAIFLGIYVAFNMAVPFISFTADKNFSILVGLPWALVDYAIFVFGVYKVNHDTDSV